MCAGYVTGFLKEMFPMLKSSGTPHMLLSLQWQRNEASNHPILQIRNVGVGTNSAPCQLHMLNTSETCAFAARSFCSHPSTGHPHLSPVFLQDLPHQFLCLQSLSTHYFLYTVARVRFPKSNLTRSTTLL